MRYRAASFEPPPQDTQQLLAATHGNQEAMDGYVSVMAGSLPVEEFCAHQRRANHGDAWVNAGDGRGAGLL